MGTALSELEKHQDAIDSYLKAIEFGKKASDWGTVARAYSNMGNALSELEKHQDAIDSYLKAIEFGEKAEQWSTVAGAYSNMGNAFFKSKKHQDAIDSYLKAIEWREFLPDRGAIVFSTTTLQICLLGIKNIQGKNYSQARELAKRLAHIYSDGEKDGMAELIIKTMVAYKSELCKEDVKAFQAFKKLYNEAKSE